MLNYFLNNFNPIKMLILITFFLGIFSLKFKNDRHRHLLVILTISFLTEISIFILQPLFDTFDPMYSVSIIIHHLVWLSLLRLVLWRDDKMLFVMIVFVLFGLTDLCFIEGFTFNYYTFIVGAFAYLFAFIYKSFYFLQKEDFELFVSNDYLLLFAPILFFLGYSIMLGFHNYKLLSAVVFGKTELYEVISTFVNLVYYLTLIIYIVRERRLERMRKFVRLQ